MTVIENLAAIWMVMFLAVGIVGGVTAVGVFVTFPIRVLGYVAGFLWWLIRKSFNLGYQHTDRLAAAQKESGKR
jgi:hypothetical protein